MGNIYTREENSFYPLNAFFITNPKFGTEKRKIKIMIVGYPNVGKKSYFNTIFPNHHKNTTFASTKFLINSIEVHVESVDVHEYINLMRFWTFDEMFKSQHGMVKFFN